MNDITLVYLPSGLPRRHCTASEPMKMADKDSYQWGHPDATYVSDFFNLAIFQCPNCGLTFHAPPRQN